MANIWRFLEVIGLIVAIVVGLQAFGFFDKSDVELYYISDLINKNQYQYFELGFHNIGERDTELCVNVSSNNLNFSFIKDRICNEIKKDTPLNYYVPFKFEVNSSVFENENGNVIITFNALHKESIIKRPILWNQNYTFIETCIDHSGCFYRMNDME